MRILFGVQATGNGHISRSREVVRSLKADGHEVLVILSGRKPELLWDVEVFEPFVALEGLTFATRRGRLQVLKTARQLNFFGFYADIRAFDARGYDLVVTDFEPISARIARRNRLPSVAIGHQYAFGYRIPVAGFDPMAAYVIRNFAPATVSLGLHWHHFEQPILPPIVPSHLPTEAEVVPNKVLVYLPFEDIQDIRRLLTPFDCHRFFVYHQSAPPEDGSHLHFRSFCRDGFLRDLAESTGVITNAGFELVSEALHLGKKVLVKPLAGQFEQVSNAKALALLKLGSTMKRLNPDAVDGFLGRRRAPVVTYPDVARLIAQWIGAGDWDDLAGLSRAAWQQTCFSAPLPSLP
jgi:uncharacterized protein (TIGR00661 family)